MCGRKDVRVYVRTVYSVLRWQDSNGRFRKCACVPYVLFEYLIKVGGCAV